MKKSYYLREINIEDNREDYSDDGESQAHVRQNPQRLLVCLCDLIYRYVTENNHKHKHKHKLVPMT